MLQFSLTDMFISQSENLRKEDQEKKWKKEGKKL